MGEVLTDDRLNRLKMGRRLALMLGTTEGRRALRNAGYQPAQPIISALSKDSIIEVFGRVVAEVTVPPAVIVVYHPGKAGLAVLSIATAAAGAVLSDPGSVHPVSTIGALADYVLLRDDQTFTFVVSEWSAPTTATALPQLAS